MQTNHTNPLHKIHDKQFQLKMEQYRIDWDYKSEAYSIIPSICVMSSVQQASVVHYLVKVSKFKLHLIMHNIQGKAPDKKTDIGKGGFGLVRTERSRDRIFVVKRQLFRSKPELEGWELANKKEIEAVLLQVAIAKICSLFEIGPQLDFSIGFDLLCYSDCTEFHMEQCQKASDEMILRSRAVLEQNLQLLHSFQIVHKDIKPNNIVYSPTLKKCVFIDFGLSQFQIYPQYLRSPTFYEGTPGFIGPELTRLRDIQGIGLANLYENDRYALARSFQKCQERIRKSNKCLSDNYFNFSQSKGPLIEEDIAALVNEQSHPNSNMKDILQQQQEKPQTGFSELNNYQFLQLLFKYASFINPAVRKDTRSCWRYLNNKQLKQMFGVLERSRNSSAIIDAVSQLEEVIGFFGEENIRLYQRLKRNIYQIGSPQLFFNQSELSIINKIRLYGFTQQFLEVFRNVQTTSFWQRLIAHIRKKPQNKKNNLLFYVNLKLDKDFAIELLAQKQKIKIFLNQSIRSPIDLVKPLLVTFPTPTPKNLRILVQPSMESHPSAMGTC